MSSIKLVELDADPQAVRSGIQGLWHRQLLALENLINAYATLYRYLKDNYDEPAKLKKYWAYLCQQCRLHTDIH